MQLRQTAADRAALTAYIDETVDDVLSAMSAIARELSRGGARLEEFDRRTATYLKRRHQLVSDPHAPDGVTAFLTRTAVLIGLLAACRSLAVCSRRSIRCRCGSGGPGAGLSGNQVPRPR